jgi:alpha-galactosidase
MKGTRIALTIILGIAVTFCLEVDASSAEHTWNGCSASLSDTFFQIGNEQYSRSWRLGDGELHEEGHSATTSWKWSVAYSTVRHLPVEAEALVAELSATRKGEKENRYQFRVYPGVAAIEVQRLVAPETHVDANAMIEQRAIEDPSAWTFTSVKLMDATDKNGHKDSLVKTVTRGLADGSFSESANIGFLEHVKDGQGTLFVKCAPLPHARALRATHNFVWDGKVLAWQGPGVNPVSGHGYPCATIAYTGGRAGRIAALQDYYRCLRQYQPARDGLLLSNTWGDRSRDSKISEAFLLMEIHAGARMGVDVMQVDDGWQKGASKNSSTVTRSKSGLWSGFWESDPKFWTPHPERLPNGLGPIATAAKKSGMHLGVWYAPDSADDFANWKRDADHMLTLHRQHGIDYFKLDSITMRTPGAEWNVQQLLNTLIRESNGEIVTDLDVTASVRPGYLGAIGAGPVFVENRYTDWKSYFPHRTLRNFWCLAEYVDPVRLRMEFLNNTRQDKQYKDNPLRPSVYPPAYLFASVMFGSPLAWFEVSEVPEDWAEEVTTLVQTWREHRENLQAGHIIPIGDVPDGSQWTGIASVAKERTSAYLVIFRETNDVSSWETRIPLIEHQSGKVEVLGGTGDASFTEGMLTVKLVEPRTYLFMKISFK